VSAQTFADECTGLRMRLLIEEIKRGTLSGRSHGVDLFEILLEPFYLSGPINAEIRKGVWEVNNVRNVIVHRNSLADRRLVKACPWMKLKPGDKVVIGHEQLRYYGVSLCNYTEALIKRLGARYKRDADLSAPGSTNDHGAVND
jgi:hypothetical protein